METDQVKMENLLNRIVKNKKKKPYLAQKGSIEEKATTFYKNYAGYCGFEVRDCKVNVEEA